MASSLCQPRSGNAVPFWQTPHDIAKHNVRARGRRGGKEPLAHVGGNEVVAVDKDNELTPGGIKSRIARARKTAVRHMKNPNSGIAPRPAITHLRDPSGEASSTRMISRARYVYPTIEATHRSRYGST